MPPTALIFFLLLLRVTAAVVPLEATGESPSCHPDQSDALIHLKNRFSISGPPSIDDYGFCSNTSLPKTASWREDEDCCLWEGVSCDHLTGDIVGLDLSCARIRGSIDSHSSLFSLTHLLSLNLAGNDFLGSTITEDISVFSRMTYLNLSSSNISGIVPTEISHLSKLVSLDLSDNSLGMQDPTARTLVKNLTELKDLDLSNIDMSEVMLDSFVNFTSSLTSLDISGSSLEGKFPDYIFQLPNLHKLDLSGNTDLRGTLPGSNWSSSLAFLSLEGCSFTGEVPHALGSLPQLTSLDLSRNNFTTRVDFRTFSTLKNIRFLGLSGLSVSGEDATNANQEFQKLEKLVMFDSSLRNFPCFLSSMPELKELYLSGSIISKSPGQCANNDLMFPQLQTLYMVSCNLTKFPSFLSLSEKLRYLYLSENMIEEIPNWFWGIGIDTLEEMYLENNLLKGRLRLPWKRLVYLHVQSNSFEGPLPIPTPSIHEFTASQNHFNGSISSSICRLTSLVYLLLDQNNLTGVIPQCLGNITGLLELDLSSNSLMGPLPRSLVNCTYLETIDVSYNGIVDTSPVWLPRGSLRVLNLRSNNFEGHWPTDIFLRFRSLQVIALSNNNFRGRAPCPGRSTNSYLISNNAFTGDISCICNATNLRIVDLSNNSLIGTMPLCLKNVAASLIYLNIRMNDFHGVFPEIFPEGSGLTSLDFSRNHFEGPLPRSLSNCLQLEVLDVGSNQIVDSFPNWLETLPLKVLSLRFNNFHGRVHESNSTHPFSELRILDLSNNGFDGSLPDNLIIELSGMMRVDNFPGYLANDNTSYMAGSDRPEFYSVMINLKGVETEIVKINVQFSTLDLSGNGFRGEIPGNIGLLKSLKGLNISHNSFQGTIPPSIGDLINLESVDISWNNLVGEIPRELVQLTSLGALDLSQNNLTGPIPLGGHFNTFPNNSFEGNPGLCGIPLTKACDQGSAEAEPPSEEPGGWFEWKFVAMGYGSGMVIGITVGYMALETGRPLWLARMVVQMEASYRKRSKRKAALRRNTRPCFICF